MAEVDMDLQLQYADDFLDHVRVNHPGESDSKIRAMAITSLENWIAPPPDADFDSIRMIIAFVR